MNVTRSTGSHPKAVTEVYTASNKTEDAQTYEMGGTLAPLMGPEEYTW